MTTTGEQRQSEFMMRLHDSVVITHTAVVHNGETKQKVQFVLNLKPVSIDGANVLVSLVSQAKLLELPD